MLSWEYPPHLVGGLGKHVGDLLPALAQEREHISLLTPLLSGGVSSEHPATHVHIIRVPPAASMSRQFLAFVGETNWELEQAARTLYTQAGGFDIIHNHDWLTASVAVRLSQQWDIPLVTTIHSTERGRGRGTLQGEHGIKIDAIERYLTTSARHIIVCSEYMVQQLIADFAVSRDKISIVPNAIYMPAQPFTSADERLAFRRHFAADHEPIGFFIGRMVHEKGVHVLLDAWERIQGCVGGRLVIAGVGPCLERYKAQAEALGLRESVMFTGKISDDERDRLYRVADVAVFPSLYEPFGIVALEAMAAQCPVIVTQTGGLQEIVRPHETGITVVPDHIDSLVWGLLHTLQNPQWSRARAQNALQAVIDTYSWQHVARQTVALYAIHAMHAADKSLGQHCVAV